MLCLGLFQGRCRKKFTFCGSSGRSLRNFSWFVYKLFTIKRSISGILKAQRMLVLRRTGAQAAMSSGSDSYFSSSPLSLSEKRPPQALRRAFFRICQDYEVQHRNRAAGIE